MSDPPIHLTRHAKNALRHLRRLGFVLSAAQIHDLVIYAHHQRTTHQGRINAWTPAEPPEWWRVTYRQEGDTAVFITVTRKERGPTVEELDQ